MAIEVGAKLTGKISGITNFGAFVDLGDKKTGLVHISEVSNGFVKEIGDILSIGDEVTVKVLSIGDDGKIALSIRQAVEGSQTDKKPGKRPHFRDKKPTEGGNFKRENNRQPRGRSFSPKRHNDNKNKDFDSLLAGFLKESEDRLTSLKRNTEGKRGGRGGRRS